MKAGCRVWLCCLLPLSLLATGCRSADPFGTLAQARGIEYHALLGEAASTAKSAQEISRSAKDPETRHHTSRPMSPDPLAPATTSTAQPSPASPSRAQTVDVAPVGQWVPTPLENAVQLGRPQPFEPSAPPTLPDG